MAEHKDEGLLDKILTLVAPPLPPSSQKGRGGNKRSKTSANSTTPTLTISAPSLLPSVRHPGMQNHPYCDACGDGGNLLCCDTCPASFHFNCCDPPIDHKSLPSGEWLCRHCKAESVGDAVPQLFHPLVELAITSNPRVFCIPYEMQRRDILPGSSRKELKQARLYHPSDQDTKEQCKFCYACNKNSSHGRMVSCDFCPLIFHLDCLQPPLTIPPSTVWMCPIHPDAKIPGFDHPRLSQRLRALEKSHADVPYHTIKTDFIKQLRRIPHYKRITRHHNRRVTEVPSAIKSLYCDPLPDTFHVPSVSDSMLTTSEDVEHWRLEDEMDRKLFATPREPVLTHDQDEWTRRAVLSQMSAPVPKCSISPRTTHSNSSRPIDESSHELHIPSSSSSSFSVLMAAQQLLELSAAKSIDRTGGIGSMEEKGVMKPQPVSPRPSTMNGFIRSHSHTLKNEMDLGLVNGGDCLGKSGLSGTLCLVDEEEEEEEGREMGTESSGVADELGHVPMGEIVSPSSSVSPSLTRVGSHSSWNHLEERRDDKEDMDTGNKEGAFVPDLSQLDPKVVQLLALQRVQQLLSKPPQTDRCHTSSNSTLEADVDTLKEQGQLLLNGWSLSPGSLPHIPHRHPMKGSLHTAPALLCPLSGTAFALPLHKQVTLVGIGSEVDVSLSGYGHCNYISSRQACIFYDKATQDYELIDYSEHGTVVDGVLYSCDFSNKSPNDDLENQDLVLTLDHLSSLGKGRRASQARARLDAARKSLKDKQEAKRALEAALRLSAPVKDDFSLAEEMSKCEGLMTRTGLKRVAATENIANSSAVVFSIPLSKTKKSETNTSHSKKGTTKTYSPARSENAQKVAEVRVEVVRLVVPEPKQTSNNNHIVDATTHLPVKPLKGGNFSETPLNSVSQGSLGQEVTHHHSVPCGCLNSPSSQIGSSDKGWEGTATLHHGSRLRFGCLQFILSLAGRPGHSELVEALTDHFKQENNDL